MSVETNPQFISDLNPDWPLDADIVKAGAQHLRNEKKTIKQTFPQIKGAVTASHLTINALTDNVVASSTLVTVKQTVDMQNKKVTNMADPTSVKEAVTLGYASSHFMDDTTSGGARPTGNVNLKNDKILVGYETGGTGRNMVKMNTSNVIEVGAAANTTRIYSNVAPIANVGGVDANILTATAAGFKQLTNVLFPVGHIMMTTVPTDYSTFMGLTWAKVAVGQVLLGADGAGAWGVGPGPGGVAGQSIAGGTTHALTVAEMPSHNHTMVHTHTVPDHHHSINHDHPAFNTASAGTHTHTVPTSHATGQDYGSNNEAYASPNSTTISGGAHAHTIDIPNYTGVSGEGGANTTGGLSTNNTGANGSGTAFRTAPPAYTVYCWRRTA